jgi:glutaminyl-peptide cyclotransferase
MFKVSLVTVSLTMAGCVSAAQPTTKFDGQRAYEHIRQLVTIGPRVAGSPGAARARDYIKAQLNTLNVSVEEQAFDVKTPLGLTRMVNLRATLPGEKGTTGPRLLIAGHYDTKLFQDEVFVGANDGGSSTAFLIELARVLKERKLALPIELVFFDGEEAVIDWHQRNDNTYGSRHYVAAAQQDGSLKDIRALILVDMIGDRDLQIRRETNSTPWLTKIIWDEARRAGRREFVDEPFEVEDDHLPFLRAGVDAVDIIDLDYAAWHTPGDTLDKVSPESLQAVGDVVLGALPEVMQRLTIPNAQRPTPK